MIGKKGVEGLPLKYLVIALVGSLTIGIALQMTGVLRQGVMTGMGVMNQSLNQKVKQSAGYKTETVPEFGVDWHFYDNGKLWVNLKSEDGMKNLTAVNASYDGEIKDEDVNMILREGQSTGDFEVGDWGEDLETGKRVSISLRVHYNDTSRYGTLKGEIEAS